MPGSTKPPVFYELVPLENGWSVLKNGVTIASATAPTTEIALARLKELLDDECLAWFGFKEVKIR